MVTLKFPVHFHEREKIESLVELHGGTIVTWDERDELCPEPIISVPTERDAKVIMKAMDFSVVDFEKAVGRASMYMAENAVEA